MKFRAETRGIRYGLLERGDAPAMARLLADAFSRRDPPAVAVGLRQSDVEHLVNIFVPKALAEGLTVVAHNKAGELVGAMLTEDFGTPPPADMAAAPSGFLPIGALLESLDEEYRRVRPVSPGSHLHLLMLGVSDSFGGLGIAQKMIALCLQEGAGRGYRHAVTEATGRASQHIFRKLGFRDLCTRQYKDFVYDERVVFQSIGEHGGASLMERGLDGMDIA